MNIFRKIKNFYLDIKQVINWVPTIYKDRDWDYCFALKLEQKKLEQIMKYYEKYGVHKSYTMGERDYRSMKWAYNCLMIVLKEDWWEINYPSDFKWFTFPPKDHDQYYNIKAYVNLGNYKRFIPWLRQEAINNTPNLWRVELREEKAWKLYHKIREQYMRSWWE